MMKREYPLLPIVGVGGIIFHNQSVLLAKRGREPSKGEWSLPGGIVELGETLIEALKREIREEVSIEVEIHGLVRLLDRIIYDQDNRVRYHYVIADYWGRMTSGTPRPGSDVRSVRFVELDRLRDMKIHKEVLKTIEMALERRT
jgi:mutator protein MutT